jgi:hypothetical protein
MGLAKEAPNIGSIDSPKIIESGIFEVDAKIEEAKHNNKSEEELAKGRYPFHH